MDRVALNRLTQLKSTMDELKQQTINGYCAIEQADFETLCNLGPVTCSVIHHFFDGVRRTWRNYDVVICFSNEGSIWHTVADIMQVRDAKMIFFPRLSKENQWILLVYTPSTIVVYGNGNDYTSNGEYGQEFAKFLSKLGVEVKDVILTSLMKNNAEIETEHDSGIVTMLGVNHVFEYGNARVSDTFRLPRYEIDQFRVDVANMLTSSVQTTF